MTNPSELLDMLMNFFYSMGLMPIVQGFFAVLAIIACVEAIRGMQK